MWPALVREYSSTGIAPALSSSIADRLQPEPFDVRVAADREHDRIGFLDRAARKMGAQAAVGALLDLLEDLAAEDTHALVRRLGMEQAAEIHVEAGQHLAAAIDDRRVDAEAGENAGELDRDVAAAADQDLLRQPLQVERLVGGDAELVPFERGMRIGPRARRDQDVLGGDGAAGALQPDPVPAGEHGARLDQLRAGLGEIGAVDPLQPRDLLVLVGDQRRPVELRRSDAPAVGGAILEVLAELRRIDEELLRNAAADDAGAADPVGFRDGNARTGLRGLAARRGRRPIRRR